PYLLANTDRPSFPTRRSSDLKLAEVIIGAVPSIEMVRMVSSGTEASMSAIRLARGFTGRDVIIKFAGCYHGHVDSLLIQAGSSADRKSTRLNSSHLGISYAVF